MRANLRTGAFVLLLAAAAVKAEVVATGLEYHWQPDSKWVRATLADMRLDPVYNWVHEFADRSVVRHQGTPDQWETRWKFTTEKSGSEILRDLESVVARAS